MIPPRIQAPSAAAHGDSGRRFFRHIQPYLTAAGQLKGRTFSEFGWIVTGQVTAALGGFIGFRILSVHLTPDVWGDVLLWQTFALLVNQVVVGGLAAAAVRYAVTSRDQGDFRSLLSALGLIMAVALGLIGLSVTTILLLGWAPALGKNWPALALVSLLGVASGLASILDATQNAFRHRATVAFHQSAGQWLRFLMATALILVFAGSKETVLAGFAFASLLVLISQFLFARRLLKNNSHPPGGTAPWQTRKWCRTIIIYAWPFAAWGVLNWLQTSVERWVIQRNLNTHDLGIYGAASQLSIQPMTMFWSALMQLLSPIIFRMADVQGNFLRARQLVAGAAGCTALLGITGALVTQLFGHTLAGLFVSQQFHEMVRYWPAMLMIAGLSGAGQVLSIYGMVRHRTDLLIFPRVAAAVVAIGLDFLLVPTEGLTGAIIAAGSGAVALCIFNGRLFSRLGHAA
jgi:O-antigen/teichoic acid export membrane protein